jgi:separase
MVYLYFDLILMQSVLDVHWFLQELLAYGAMESRATMLCENMQNRIIDILLNEIYCSKEYYLDRSKVLVRKARIFRASGMQNISSCLDSLSVAISLLVSPPFPYLMPLSCPVFLFISQARSKVYFLSSSQQDILLDSSRGNAVVIHELVIAYCLHAHCAQEANPDGKVTASYEFACIVTCTLAITYLCFVCLRYMFFSNR